MTEFAGGPAGMREQCGETSGSAASGLLILGWHAQLGEAAIARGLRPVVLYGPVERNWAEPVPEPDCVPVYCADPARLEASIPALSRAGIALSDLTSVCPAGESYVTAASEYASLLRLPGLPLQTAIACRDKAVQKSLIKEAGLACANFHTIRDPESIAYADGKIDWHQYPAVLKPVAGVGATSTDRVGSDAETRAALSRKGPAYLISPHMIEQFIDAEQEWHLDGYTRHGEVRFLSIGVYTRPLLTMREGTPVGGTLLDPDTDADSFRRAYAFTGRAMKALGLTDSVFHAEVFVRAGDDEFIFSECAARPAGSAIPQAVSAKHGVDLYAAHLDLWLGHEVAPPGAPRADCVAWIQLNTKSGVLLDHPSTDDLLSRPGVMHAALQYPRGWSLPSSREGTNFRMGYVVVSGRDPEETLARMTDVAAWFDRNLRVGPARKNNVPAWILRMAGA